MIRIDALWLATAPLDMRAGPDKALGRVVEVFGAARLHQGRFVWPQGDLAAHIELNPAQWQALIMGLPWQRLQADGAIRVV